MRGLYKPHARPLTRIVHGLPTSWDPSTAVTRFPGSVDAAAWSPCSRSIAISWGEYPPTVMILDAATLVRLTTLEPPTGELGIATQLIFSPGGRLLTWFGSGGAGSDRGKFISWDLQTGVLVSAISAEDVPPYGPSPITYSACGMMFGVLSRGSSSTTINTYNALSGTHTCSHPVEGPVSGEIWVHGECLRFTTITPGSITTWEAGFTSTCVPTEVETLSIPDDFHNPEVFLAHPTLPRLALVREGRVCVWDTQGSKFLLDSAHVGWDWRMSFSPDGRLFACNSMTPEGKSAGIHLWKESDTGYVLHQKLISDFGAIRPLISPNGGSAIAFGGFVIQLWHTMNPTTSVSTVSAQTSQSSGKIFILRFSQDEALAAVVRKKDKAITVLDLKSGIPRLIIDTGMEVYCLGVTGSSTVAVDDKRIVTWNLPAGGRITNPRVNITDSVRTATLDHDFHGAGRSASAISVSPDLHRIAIVDKRTPNSHRIASAKTRRGDGAPGNYSLYLYDVPTGQHIGTKAIERNEAPTPWFTPDGREVWCVGNRGTADKWKIVEDCKSDVTELKSLGSTTHRPDGFPRPSSRGYQVVDGRWILSPSKKRLFWLPLRWRSDEWERMWGKRFLALLHSGLPEAVILELE